MIESECSLVNMLNTVSFTFRVSSPIWGISPSDEYYDETANAVAVKIRKNLIDSEHLKEGKIKLLPH